MSEDAPRSDSAGSSTALKRGISPTLLLLFIVGDMVGGGIYALVGKIAGVTGGAIWSALLLALVLAVFTAFSYTVNDGRKVQRLAVEKCGAGVGEGLSLDQGLGAFQ